MEESHGKKNMNQRYPVRPLRNSCLMACEISSHENLDEDDNSSIKF